MKSSTSLLRPFLVALTLLAVPGAAAFTQSHERTIEQLVSSADVVALGTVTSLQSEWNADRTRISTRVTVAVAERFKGEGEETMLEIIVPGGEVGEIGEIYSHVPRFFRDEQVMLFARRAADGTYRVAAGDRGKIVVSREERTRRLVVETGEVLESFTTRVRRAAAAPLQR